MGETGVAVVEVRRMWGVTVLDWIRLCDTCTTFHTRTCTWFEGVLVTGANISVHCLWVRIWNLLDTNSHFDRLSQASRAFLNIIGLFYKGLHGHCIYISWSLNVELAQATFGSWMDVSSTVAAIQNINICLPRCSFNLQRIVLNLWFGRSRVF